MENICQQIGVCVLWSQKGQAPKTATGLPHELSVLWKMTHACETEAHSLLSLCYRITSSLVLLGLQILILPLFRFSTFVFKRTEEVSCLCLQRASPNLKKKSLWGKKLESMSFKI